MTKYDIPSSLMISDHLLQGGQTGQIRLIESQNRGGLFKPGALDTVVIHYTAEKSVQSAVEVLCDPQREVSAHLVIGRDNSVVQLLPFDRMAWHAGRSCYGGRVGFNQYSIGIEIDNAGQLTKDEGVYRSWFGQEYEEKAVFQGIHRNQSGPTYWHRYTEDQIEIVEDICVLLVREYNVRLILGHEEISPGRKIDPGPAFPLDEMRDRVLRARH